LKYGKLSEREFSLTIDTARIAFSTMIEMIDKQCEEFGLDGRVAVARNELKKALYADK